MVYGVFSSEVRFSKTLKTRLFQSRGAVAINDRSPMVTFVKRLGVLRIRIPLLFRRKS